MRFFITTDDPGHNAVSLGLIAEGLRQADPAYRIVNTHIPDLGELYYGDLFCGEIEISRADEDIFAEEIDEFITLVKYQPDQPNAARVQDVLGKARAMVVIEATWEGEDYEPVLDAIDGVWDWLYAAYPHGLVQAENEGFYDSTDLILEITVHL